jgi:hypothetical protein
MHPRRGHDVERAPLGCIFAGVTLIFLSFAATWAWRTGSVEASDDARCSLSGVGRTAETIDLRGCGLRALPPALREFVVLRKLDASSNQLSTLPSDLPRSLEVLFLSANQFATLPPELARLASLRMLALRGNALIGALPAGLLPSRLEWLILTDNAIEALPHDIGGPRVEVGADARAAPCRLQKLMLANNALAWLPPSLARCERLELVRLSNNRLAELPPFLLRMPRLAWLALASNPAVEAARAPATLPRLRLGELSVSRAGPALGEGTSGVVYRGSLRGSPVAVKLYKAQRTSDGLTADEAAAAAAAAAAPSAGLARTLALVVADDHEAGAAAPAAAGAGTAPPPAGVVLEWLPGWRSLGAPPSLESISRDTYGAAVRFEPSHALRIATSICDGLAQLHALRLTHGDVYAHNTLVDDAGAAKLSDFGASYSYARARVAAEGAQPFAAAGAADGLFERLEVRAFGILLDELAVRTGPAPAEGVERVARLQARLRKLAARASAVGDVALRPSFAQVCAELDAHNTEYVAGTGRGLRV